MSKYCPECKMLSYNEQICDKCGYQISTITPHKNYTHKPKKDIKTYIIAIGISIIALSTLYIAYTKYQEKKTIDNYNLMMFGTTDPKKFKESMERQGKEMEKVLDREMEKYKKAILGN